MQFCYKRRERRLIVVRIGIEQTHYDENVEEIWFNTRFYRFVSLRVTREEIARRKIEPQRVCIVEVMNA